MGSSNKCTRSAKQTQKISGEKVATPFSYLGCVMNRPRVEMQVAKTREFSGLDRLFASVNEQKSLLTNVKRAVCVLKHAVW